MTLWFFSHSKGVNAPREQPTRRPSTQSLLHYETGTFPPSSRVDPKAKRVIRRPLRIWDFWKVGAFVASKGASPSGRYLSRANRVPPATEVTTDVLSHHIWGPRRKSWGIEMTILSSLFRNAGRHSALVDIVSLCAKILTEN
jgi:hypothetical protein